MNKGLDIKKLLKDAVFGLFAVLPVLIFVLYFNEEFYPEEYMKKDFFVAIWWHNILSIPLGLIVLACYLAIAAMIGLIMAFYYSILSEIFSPEEKFAERLTFTLVIAALSIGLYKTLSFKEAHLIYKLYELIVLMMFGFIFYKLYSPNEILKWRKN